MRCYVRNFHLQGHLRTHQDNLVVLTSKYVEKYTRSYAPFCLRNNKIWIVVTIEVLQCSKNNWGKPQENLHPNNCPDFKKSQPFPLCFSSSTCYNKIIIFFLIWNKLQRQRISKLPQLKSSHHCHFILRNCLTIKILCHHKSYKCDKTEDKGDHQNPFRPQIT